MKKHNPSLTLFAMVSVVAVGSLVCLGVSPSLAADPPTASPVPAVRLAPFPPRKRVLSAEERKQSLALEKSIARVQQEIDRLPNHPWVGAYRRGTLTSEWLYVAPESGFLFVQYYCMGSPSQQSGSVQVVPTGIRLRSKGGGFFRDTLIPVQWGQRRYLIEARDMKGFCTYANASKGVGYYLLHKGDENKAVSGLPDVPAEFRHYLLPRPLNGKVIAVGPPLPMQLGIKGRFWCEVTVNLGSADGVYKGMWLWSPDASGGYRTELAVTSVDGSHRCRASAQPNPVDGPLPKRGWTISSTESTEQTSPSHEKSSKKL